MYVDRFRQVIYKKIVYLRVFRGRRCRRDFIYTHIRALVAHTGHNRTVASEEAAAAVEEEGTTS